MQKYLHETASFHKSLMLLIVRSYRILKFFISHSTILLFYNFSIFINIRIVRHVEYLMKLYLSSVLFQNFRYKNSITYLFLPLNIFKITFVILKSYEYRSGKKELSQDIQFVTVIIFTLKYAPST